MFAGNEENLDTMQGKTRAKTTTTVTVVKDQEEYRRRADGR